MPPPISTKMPPPTSWEQGDFDKKKSSNDVDMTVVRIFFLSFYPALMVIFCEKKGHESRVFFPEKQLFFVFLEKITMRAVCFYFVFFYQKHPALMPFFSHFWPFFLPKCPISGILLFLQKVHIFRFFILWLGVAPNFSVFFCEFRPAGCLALQAILEWKMWRFVSQ